ncbi:MAG: phosphonoacetaldehyde reductase [Eubacterium sp.]
MGQQIIEGIDSFQEIVKSKKFLLVCDVAYDFLDIKDRINKYEHVVFSDFTPNPLYEQVCEGIKLFHESACDMIVAVGGGSAIDVAKCIKLFSKMNQDINYLEQEKFDTQIPLVAIPTTAGTGSESTKHAVIYYKGTKQSISHDSIVPDYAILEPSVLKTLPLYQKQCTMMDALCQAIESWWSVNSTDESKDYSRKAIRGITSNWKEYLDENTVEARKNIMLAANYAGRAINITATTAAHAMSYKITSLYGFPHGHAVALCMKEVWKYMLSHTGDCIDDRGERYLKETFDEIAKCVSISEFDDMFDYMKLQYPLSNNRETDIAVLTESVNPVRLKNNPVKLSEDVLRDMYERIIKE